MAPTNDSHLPVRARAARGQTLALGAVAMLVLALTVMITINIAIAVQQKISLQNYADAKAFSTAVAEARALNYFAYTNRAIASSYVGMANLHAYMSEAAMLADLKTAGATIMFTIAAEETAQAFCCAPLPAPCCAQHLVHAAFASFNGAMQMVSWATGDMGRKIRELDDPAGEVMDALDLHILALHGSQVAVQGNVYVMLINGGPSNSMKKDHMQKADQYTHDDMNVTLQNGLQWNDLFYTEDEKKRRIMAEVANATRQPFTWNRHLSTGTPLGPQAILFPPNWVGENVKGLAWLGEDGMWGIGQTPDAAVSAGGRSGFTDKEFPWQVGGFVAVAQDAPASTATGRTVNSFDWGTLYGQWQDGVGIAQLPLFGPAGAGELMSGDDGDRHRADFGILDVLNRPHASTRHNKELGMERFMEFKIGTEPPYNQPSVYAAVSTDSRYNEHGVIGPWRITEDDSGTISAEGFGDQTGEITVTNNATTKAFSKAMVYYHRIGDWADYPNFFNPYWRAKLHPMTSSEILTALTPTDPEAALVAGEAALISNDTAAAVNVIR